MKETKFIEQNQEKWAAYEEMLQDGRHDTSRLNELFIQITDDLSYARTYYPNRSVRTYLNNLAQRVFHRIYKGKRFPLERMRAFWADELPRILWEERRLLLLSLAIFVLAFCIGLVSSILKPEFARVILGNEYVDMTLQNIENGDPMAVYKESKPLGMTIGIALNNLRVALMTAVMGVLAALGTVFLLLYNGIMVGAFQYFFIEKGLFWESFLTIWIHGTIEISSIIVAGAAGMVAGSGLLFPGTYRRTQAFQRSLRRGMKILLGVAPLIVLAAIFEGFLTRYTHTPAPVRGLFIAVSLLFVLWFFVWYPWHRARLQGFQKLEDAMELPPDRMQPIVFNMVKSGGEILTDAFTVLRRQSRLVFWAVISATGLMLTYAYGLSSASLVSTFAFEEEWTGVLKGTGAFFMNEAVPFLWPMQVLLVSGLALTAFFALEKELPEDQRRLWDLRSMVMVLLGLCLPAAGLILLFQQSWTSGLWLLSIIGVPFLAVWMSIIYYEHTNPFTALGRTFRLANSRQGAAVGLLVMILGFIFFLFLASPAWSFVLRLFEWMVPPGTDHVLAYHAVSNAISAAFLLYLNFAIHILCGAFLYFSNREISDAASLRDGIEKIGVEKRIRGLARE